VTHIESAVPKSCCHAEALSVSSTDLMSSMQMWTQSKKENNAFVLLQNCFWPPGPLNVSQRPKDPERWHLENYFPGSSRVRRQLAKPS
jgi:hypothetical protein